MTLYLIYSLLKKYILIINKWFIDNFMYNTRFSIIFSMFLVKNVDKNKWSSNRQKFKNAQLQFQKPGSYKKKSVKKGPKWVWIWILPSSKHWQWCRRNYKYWQEGRLGTHGHCWSRPETNQVINAWPLACTRSLEPLTHLLALLTQMI